MVKCKIKDSNSDEALELTITADINHLSPDDPAGLLQKTAELAKEFAEKLGYIWDKRGACVAE